MQLSPHRIAPVLLLALGLTACAEPVRVTESWSALGATVEVELLAANEASGARVLGHIREGMARTAAALGPDGDLGELNRLASDDYYRIQHLDLYRVLRLSMDWARVSQGAYDPTAAPLRHGSVGGARGVGGPPTRAWGEEHACSGRRHR